MERSVFSNLAKLNVLGREGIPSYRFVPKETSPFGSKVHVISHDNQLPSCYIFYNLDYPS